MNPPSTGHEDEELKEITGNLALILHNTDLVNCKANQNVHVIKEHKQQVALAT
jgi:hypothetical protein